MIILGLDPSYTATGYALIETEPEERALLHGAWKYPGENPRSPEALLWYSFKLRELLVRAGAQEYAPEIIGIERPVYVKNEKTFRQLSYLTGALLAAMAWSSSARVLELEPSKRRAVLGIPMGLKGKDAKAAILGLVNARFGLDLQPRDHDIADAFAIALAAERELRLEVMRGSAE